MISLDELKGRESLGSRKALESILGNDILIERRVAIKITGIYVDDLKLQDGQSHPIRVADGYVYHLDYPEKKSEPQLFIYKTPYLFYFQLLASVQEYFERKN